MINQETFYIIIITAQTKIKN